MKRVVTTIAVSPQFSDKIERAAKANRQSKKEYLESLFSYIERYGINPDLHEPPLVELEKMSKRLDQVIRFIKVQEKEILTPAVETMLRSKQALDPVGEQVRAIKAETAKVYSALVKLHEMYKGNLSSLVDYIKEINSDLQHMRVDIVEIKEKQSDKKGGFFGR